MGIGLGIMIGCVGAGVIFLVWRLCIKLSEEDARRREDEENE